ncbi:hypothetical protein Tco_0640854, partial [Tanacetum coccineum]
LEVLKGRVVADKNAKCRILDIITQWKIMGLAES